MRIVLFGDSVFAGYGLAPDEAPAARLAAAIRERKEGDGRTIRKFTKADAAFERAPDQNGDVFPGAGMTRPVGIVAIAAAGTSARKPRLHMSAKGRLAQSLSAVLESAYEETT